MKNRSILVLFAVVYVILFCWLGFYSYPSADDYNLVDMVERHGLFQAPVQWYTAWGVSPVALFMVSIPAWLNFKGYFLLPLITCFFNICALYSLIHVIDDKLSAWKKLSYAFLLQAAWLAVVPGLNENFYWLCAMSYTWTGTLLIFTGAFIMRFFKKEPRDFKTGLACAVSIFVSSMYMAQVAPFLCAAFFCIALLQSVSKKYITAVYCIAAFFIAFAGFLVLYLSPGTTARMSAVGPLPPISARLFRTFAVAAVFGGVTALKFFIKPIVYVFLLFLPVIAAHIVTFDSKISSRLKMWHIFALVALIAPLMQSIAGWAMGNALPERAEGLAIWIMGTSWVCLWAFGYRNEAVFERIRSLRVYRRREILLILCLVLSGNFISLVRDLSLAPSYAAQMKEREASIIRQKSEGKDDVIVPSLTIKPKLLFFTDIRPSPSDWKNQGLAGYYDVRSITALPENMLDDEQAIRNFREGSLSGLAALAEAGDPEVQFMLGEIYDARFAPYKDVTKDDTAAAGWYRMAAAQGYAHAQRRLVRLYAFGMGVPKNYFYAITWLLRSQF